MKHVATFFALTIFAAAAEDPGGWTAAKWGMTVDQVRTAVPEAHTLAGPAADRTIDKRLAPLGIDRVEIARVPWKVLFLFGDDGGLCEVYLDSTSPAGVSPQMFVTMEELLLPKYGRPFDRQTDKSRTALWTLGTTSIELHYTSIPQSPLEFLWLSYRRADPKASPYI